MPIKRSCFIHGEYEGETCPQCETAPPSVPVESIVGFCAWAWDKDADRWVTRCGYGFTRQEDKCDTGEFLPFPFCPYCGERIRKPNATHDGRRIRRTVDGIVGQDMEESNGTL